MLQCERIAIIELGRVLPGLSVGISSQECAECGQTLLGHCPDDLQAFFRYLMLWLVVYFAFKPMYSWSKLLWLWVCCFWVLLDLSLLTLFWKVRICDNNVTGGSVASLFFFCTHFGYYIVQRMRKHSPLKSASRVCKIRVCTIKELFQGDILWCVSGTLLNL